MYVEVFIFSINKRTESARLSVLTFFETVLLRREFLYSGIEAGLAASGIVLLDDILFRSLIECLLCFQEPLFRTGDIGFGDGFARTFDRALDHTFDGAIAERVLRSDTHVLLGGLFDRHRRYFKLKSDEKTQKSDRTEKPETSPFLA